MPTRLSRYCEGVMEAAWLAALVVVPVFFNIYSSRIFEPDKITLLRSLALVSLGAWAVKIIDQKGVHQHPSGQTEPAWYKPLLRTPLIPQVLLLGAVFILANIFSVTPRVSFWGSYQRLQGTYSTLSYMIIFATIVANLRRRAQVERLVMVAIIASLPVGLYGILQRFEIDPVPWGGAVNIRIAANMGNSIFVAAYLIMAFPLTVGRIVSSFSAILREENALTPHVARGTIYVFTASIQLIALYLSGSRGPILGLLAGSFFFFVLLSLYWGKRWLTLSTLALAAGIGAFLVVFNISNGPLANLQSVPGLGRLGKVFEVDTGTGRVRALIWQGASELVFPHDPIDFPDGTQDTFNVLRPFIGYGPESMYVAYNPFYPPALANLEARNASPDRSHNETWDSLVISGFLGLVVYLTLFTSIFYYGLKWLRMINTPRQRNLFLALIFGGGIASASALISWGGIGFLGVGFPFGMLIGLIAYLTLISLFSRYDPPETIGEKVRALTLIMFLAAIISHFAEIHFGIAIAATRTYFWIYTGVLLVVGHIMSQEGVFGVIARDTLTDEIPVEASSTARQESSKIRSKRKLRASLRGRRLSGKTTSKTWQRHATIGGVSIAFVLVTLGFDFITNPNRATSPIQILWGSLTTLPNKDFQVSYGILTLIITLWLAASILFTAESVIKSEKAPVLLPLGATLGISSAISLLFWLMHASSLAALVTTGSRTGGLEGILSQVGQMEGFLTRFYIFIFLLILLLARFLPHELPTKGVGNGGFSVIAIPIILLAVSFGVSRTNLRVIQADIAFKLADPFARGNQPDQWDVAIELYQRAKSYAPSEDHYYLFLGRAYLELARLLQSTNPDRTESLMEQAESDLEFAQSINPLNTDHTANLARLHRFWSSLVPNQQEARNLAVESSDYYSTATTLSPNNAVLWNEWAVLNMLQLQDSEKSLELLNHSKEIDPLFHTTSGILGDFYAQSARSATDEQAKKEIYGQAIMNYSEAIAKIRGTQDLESKYNYWLALGSVYTELQDYEKAIESYTDALPFSNPNQVWRIEDTLARLYAQLGDRQLALVHANTALASAPDNQKNQVQELINFLQQNP